MRITSIQQTNYTPEFNGEFILKDFKTGKTIEKEISAEADKVLTKMFEEMTEYGCFEGRTFICGEDFIKYRNMIKKLTGIKEIDTIDAPLDITIGHYYPAIWGGTYSLREKGYYEIFHKYI